MSYRAYNQRIYRSTDRVSCNLCDSFPRRPADHARHVLREHGLKNRTHCPWCCEPFEEKGVAKNVPHLLSCFVQFVRYDRCVRRAKFSVTCCDGQKFLPLDYVHHVYSEHGLDKNSDCPWCEGRKDMSLSHRLTCLERKIEEQKKKKRHLPPKVVCEPCIEFDSPKESLAFYGRPKLQGIGPSFYEPFPSVPWFVVEEEEDGPRRVRFDAASGLGGDAPLYVARFMGAKDYCWLHVFISAMAYDSFHEALQQTQSVHLLPFSCLCSGGDAKYEPAYRHHRHGIAVSPSRKAFAELWKHVKFPEQKYKGQNCKYALPIQKVHHLCNVMNYVSGRSSMCKGIDFNVGKKKQQQQQQQLDYELKTKKRNHYHIFRPFSLHANRYLHMCYEEGPQQYMELRHGQRHVWNLENLKWENKRAYVEIRDLPGELDLDGCRPPLAPDLMECEQDRVVIREGRVVEQSFVGLWTLEGRPVHLVKRDPPRTCSKRKYFEESAVVDPHLKYFLTRSQNKTATQLKMERKWVGEHSKREEQQNEKEKQVMRRELQQKDCEIEKLLSKISTLRKEKEVEIHLQQKDYEILSSENASLRKELGLKDDFSRQIHELRVALEAKDREIKQLMVDRLAEVVKHNLENRDLSDREKRLLMRHHATMMRQMEEKLDLKDKICFLWEQLVSAWLRSSVVLHPPRKQARFQ